MPYSHVLTLMPFPVTLQNEMFSGQTTKKYSIPLDHLDYKYVSKCDKVEELEKILRVLRSVAYL